MLGKQWVLGAWGEENLPGSSHPHLSLSFYLHVLDLPQVGILGGEQQCPGLVQLGLDPQGLVVEQRELGLQTLVLRGLLHHLLRDVA